MPLISQAIINAAEIDSINREITGVIRHMLNRSYYLVMQDPQGVMDALGSNAAAALSRYAALYAALAGIGESGDLTAPNLDVFQSQQDGTVVYVAPEPEPEPEPDQEP